MVNKYKNLASRALKSTIIKASAPFNRRPKSPDQVYGQLFVDVQKQRIYEDGKTFVDVVPKGRVKQIQQRYAIQCKNPDFNLQNL